MCNDGSTESELIQLLFCGDIRVHGNDLDVDNARDEIQVLESPDGTFYVTIARGHPLEDRLPGLMKLLFGADLRRMLDIFQTSRFELQSHFGQGPLLTTCCISARRRSSPPGVRMTKSYRWSQGRTHPWPAGRRPAADSPALSP